MSNEIRETKHTKKSFLFHLKVYCDNRKIVMGCKDIK